MELIIKLGDKFVFGQIDKSELDLPYQEIEKRHLAPAFMALLDSLKHPGPTN